MRKCRDLVFNSSQHSLFIVKVIFVFSSKLREYLEIFIRRLRSNNDLLLNLGVVVFLILILRVYFKLVYYLVLLSIVATTLLIQLKTIPRKYEESTRKLIITSLLLTSRGLKSSEIRFLSSLLKYIQIITIILATLTVTYTLIFGFNMILVISTIIALSSLLVLLILPRLLVYSWASQRKTSIEVELPYLVILLRVLSVLKIPIYDILNIVENSIALPASAREVKFARKIATMTGTSLLGALDMVYAHHPSEKVVNFLRRIIIAASTHGDFSSVAEKVFDTIYTWFESKVSGLVSNFTIIVGTSLFAYLFVPVIVAAIAPVMGGSLLIVLGVSLTIQVFIFFTLYAIILSLYPSSLIIKPSKRLKSVSLGALLIVVSVVLYNVFSLVAGREPLGGHVTLGLIITSTTITLIFSEVEFRRVFFYDTFVRVSSEALSIAAATGENPVTVLERSAVKYGKRIIRFTKTITTGYISEKLKRGIISRAPSIFHASFLETLLSVFRLGATPEMLKLFTSSYERLNTQVLRVKSFTRTLEAIMAGLVAIIGGFLAYIDKVFNTILNIIQSAMRGVSGSLPMIIPFTYDPRIYSLLDNLSLLSLLFVSIFIGCVRGGSYAYSFRSFLIMLIIYIVFKTIMQIIAF